MDDAAWAIFFLALGALLFGLGAIVGYNAKAAQLHERACHAEFKLATTETDSLRVIVAHRQCEEFSRKATP